MNTPRAHDRHVPAVEVHDLRCRYGDFEAVRGIDLQAQPGELLAVLGTNRAGKTAIMEVIEGRRPADSGWVSVLGRDPYRDRRALAARVGVVFQESALPEELTPREFLRLWHRVAGDGKLDHRPVDEQLTRVDLAHRRDVRIRALSGGERRRLDLAIALSADPELLFLDEPTAGLDPESRADTWELSTQPPAHRYHRGPDHPPPRGSRSPGRPPGDPARRADRGRRQPQRTPRSPQRARPAVPGRGLPRRSGYPHREVPS